MAADAVEGLQAEQVDRVGAFLLGHVHARVIHSTAAELPPVVLVCARALTAARGVTVAPRVAVIARGPFDLLRTRAPVDVVAIRSTMRGDKHRRVVQFRHALHRKGRLLLIGQVHLRAQREVTKNAEAVAFAREDLPVSDFRGACQPATLLGANNVPRRNARALGVTYGTAPRRVAGVPLRDRGAAACVVAQRGLGTLLVFGPALCLHEILAWNGVPIATRIAAVRTIRVVGANGAHVACAALAAVFADAVAGAKHELVVAVRRPNRPDANERKGWRRRRGRWWRIGRRGRRRGRRSRRRWAWRRRRRWRWNSKLVSCQPQRAQIVLGAKIIHDPLRTVARTVVRHNSARVRESAQGTPHSHSRWSHTKKARHRWGVAWNRRV